MAVFCFDVYRYGSSANSNKCCSVRSDNDVGCQLIINNPTLTQLN
jgi:hypothetical protein